MFSNIYFNKFKNLKNACKNTESVKISYRYIDSALWQNVHKNTKRVLYERILGRKRQMF